MLTKSSSSRGKHEQYSREGRFGSAFWISVSKRWFCLRKISMNAALVIPSTINHKAIYHIWLLIVYTWRPLGRGQDAESNFVNPHSFRNLSAYSWKIPLTVFIPSGLIPRTLLQSIQREQWFAHFSADRMPKWHNLLPQPFLILSAL